MNALLGEGATSIVVVLDEVFVIIVEQNILVRVVILMKIDQLLFSLLYPYIEIHNH